MGTQIHAGDNYRRVVELIQTGAIGPVTRGARLGRPGLGPAVARGGRAEPATSSPSRERPERHVADPDRARLGPLARPRAGAAVQRGLLPRAEMVSLVGFRQRHHERPGQPLERPAVLGTQAPGAADRSRPSARRRIPEIAPASMHVDLRIRRPRRHAAGAAHLVSGRGQARARGRQARSPSGTAACLFVGDKGMLLADYGKHVLLPEKDFRDFKRPEPFIPKSLGHHAEWIHACKTGAPTTCNFEYAGWLTEANHLGNVAYRTGKKLEWDAAKLYARNAPEAEPFIRREYRKGWTLG